jgi:hypothetical protein
MDTAEHMFTKCKQLTSALTPSTAETLADLLYEIGKDALTKRNYEVAARWLERAYDTLGEQDPDSLRPEVSELRLSAMQSIGMCTTFLGRTQLTAMTVQAYMKSKTAEAQEKAWQMVKLMETVSLLRPLEACDRSSHA